MSEIVSRSTSREQFNTLLMTVFAASALVLAAIGIYGVMAYAVQQRTQEIGIRLALGAQPSNVRTMVVLQGMRLAVVGVVIGVAAAFALSRFMSTSTVRRQGARSARVRRRAAAARRRRASRGLDPGAAREPHRPARRAPIGVEHSANGAAPRAGHHGPSTQVTVRYGAGTGNCQRALNGTT